MGEILGVGATHYPMLLGDPSHYSALLKTRVLPSPAVPAEWKDSRSWPRAMQQELENEEAISKEHQAGLIDGFRRVRKAIDDFNPDAIILFGDDQYENFKEDCIPPFCVLMYDQMESR